MSNFSRREFLQSLTAASVTAMATSPSKLLGQDLNSIETFDYIIVGTGAGGGPLACRLVKAGFKVLCIEAGPREVNQNSEIPAFHLKATEDKKYVWNYFVRHFEKDESHGIKFQNNKRGMLYPRGSALGGSTTVNALLAVYPNEEDWEYLEKLTGDKKFNPRKMRSLYESKVREWLPLETTPPHLALKDRNLIQMFFAGFQETVKKEGASIKEVLKNIIDFDPNSDENVRKGEEGMFLLRKMTKNGKRFQVRDYILETQKQYPERLFIVTDTFVNKILFSDETGETTKAIGIECLSSHHAYEACPEQNPQIPGLSHFLKKKYHASKEVIISAGAFNSPQILMLSGIGDQTQLEKHGIKTRVHLPGVGKNLQDRYEMTLVNSLGSPSGLIENCTFAAAGDECLKDYKSDGNDSIYGSNGLVVGIKVKSSPSLRSPDLMIFGGPAMFKGYYPHYSKDGIARSDTFTWAVLKGQTLNTKGEVNLASSDPLKRPLIDFKYFAEGEQTDLNAVLSGIKMTRQIVKRYNRMKVPFIEKKAIEEFPGPIYDTDHSLKNVIKREVWGHHASCSNKIGTKDDIMAVVDGQFKVHGTSQLRVVDASVFPKIPGLFIVIPTFMIAEKAALDILEDA